MLRHSNYERKKDTVIWPSFVAPFQLPLLRRSNYDRKKKIQSSVHCYAIPILTEKKKIQSSDHHSLRRSNHHCCAVPITTEKKDTVVCPLLRHYNYDRKKKYSHLAIIRCAVPIAIVAPFQLQPEKKDTVIYPLLRRSNYDRKNIKIQSSGHHSLRRSNCHCCAVPITTGKKDTVVCPLLRHSNYDRKKRYTHTQHTHTYTYT